MKTFKTIPDIIQNFNTWSTKEKAGQWQGIDDYKDMDMHVVRNCILELSNIKDKESLRDLTGADQPWSEMHFLERINGIPSNPGETYKIWPYANLNKENKFKSHQFDHTYMERFWPKYAGDTADNPREGVEQGIRFQLGDLSDVIKNLKENNLTRQAYLPIWFPEDTWAANNNKRVPCSLGYHFYISKNKLCINYTIRSCDLFRHFRNDIYLAYRLLQHVAKQIDISAGTLTMIIYNLHLFTNDEYMFNKKEFSIRNGPGKKNT